MIVDTSVLIAILKREPNFEAFLEVMVGAVNPLSISAATMFEAHTVVQRLGVDGLETQLGQLIEDVSITIQPFAQHQLPIAATAYRTYGKGSGHAAQLNFGDCFAYALAKDRDEPLLFKGNDFSQTDLRPALA